jgi:Glycosyltransferase family 29 (sialyltransferase)
MQLPRAAWRVRACVTRLSLRQRLALGLAACVFLVLVAVGGFVRGPLFNEYSAPGQPSAVLWDRQSALDCVRRRCFSTSAWVKAAMMMSETNATGYEERVLEMREFRDSWGWRLPIWDWPGRREVKKLLPMFKRRSCSVVGGAFFETEKVARSRDIDAQDLIFRVNMALPFEKKGTGFPNATAQVLPELGMGTRTDVLVMNYIAMRTTNCFQNLPPILAAHLKDTVIFFHLHTRNQVNQFLECRQVIRTQQVPTRMFALHPALRLEDAALLNRTQIAFRVRRGSYATSGFSAVTAALNLCDSVKAFGFQGPLTSNYANETYKYSSHHNLVLERLAMKQVSECKDLRRDSVCEKLTLVE